MTDNQKLIAEARAIAPGVALSALDLIPDGEQQHGCIISDGAATKDGVVSAFRLLYRLADALEAAEKAHTPTGHAKGSDTSTERVNNGADSSHVTPTDDEREALTLIVRDVHNYDGRPGYLSLSGADAGRIAEAILAAGFHRSVASESSVEAWVCGKCGGAAYEHSLTTSTCIWEPVETRPEPQGEPSDAQVEAAAQAMFEPDGPGGEYTWAEMVVEDVSRADIWREDARKVLRAAGIAGGEHRG